MNRLSIVAKKEKDDCGICALACGTGRPWHEVKAAIWAGRVARQERRRVAMQHFDENHSNRTNGIDLIEAARRLGWQFLGRIKQVKDGQWPPALVEGSSFFYIVGVQYQNTRCGHWVVYDGNMVYDSAWDCPVAADRTYCLKPLSYILFVKNPSPTEGL